MNGIYEYRVKVWRLGSSKTETPLDTYTLRADDYTDAIGLALLRAAEEYGGTNEDYEGQARKIRLL